nr:hypothetical protein [Pseudonocardia hierapolitana]
MLDEYSTDGLMQFFLGPTRSSGFPATPPCRTRAKSATTPRSNPVGGR